MALALYRCVWAGLEDTPDHPTILEKKADVQTGPQCLVVIQAGTPDSVEAIPSQATFTSFSTVAV